MSERFQAACPSCGGVFTISEKDIGKAIKCRCGYAMQTKAKASPPEANESQDSGGGTRSFGLGLILFLFAGIGLAFLLILGGVGVGVWWYLSSGEPDTKPAKGGSGSAFVAIDNGQGSGNSLPPKVDPPVGNIPTVEVVRVTPAEPQVGDTLLLEVTGSVAHGGPLRYYYRTTPAANWLLAPGGRVSLTLVSEGKLEVEIRSEDGKGVSSPTVRRSWQISAAKGVEVGKGSPGKNSNALLQKYRGRLTLTASSSYSGWPTDRLVDENMETSWFSSSSDYVVGRNRPWFQIAFPEDVTVSRITIFGNREPQWPTGYTILSGTLMLYDGNNRLLKSINADGVGQLRDFDFTFLPTMKSVRSAKFLVTSDQGNSVAVAEVHVE